LESDGLTQIQLATALLFGIASELIKVKGEPTLEYLKHLLNRKEEKPTMEKALTSYHLSRDSRESLSFFQQLKQSKQKEQQKVFLDETLIDFYLFELVTNLRYFRKMFCFHLQEAFPHLLVDHISSATTTS